MLARDNNASLVAGSSVCHGWTIAANRFAVKRHCETMKIEGEAAVSGQRCFPQV
jgi:hypothetical protein